MYRSQVKRVHASAGVLTAALLLASCAVGPDFQHPAAPAAGRYTKEPLAPVTSSTDAPTGQPQRFVQGRDIPQEWWTLFRSPELNALIERSLKNNPTLQSAISSLRAAKEAVYAQQGKFFPLVQANFNPTRGKYAQIYSTFSFGTPPITTDVYTAQVMVSYTFDVSGSQSANRRIAASAG